MTKEEREALADFIESEMDLLYKRLSTEPDEVSIRRSAYERKLKYRHEFVEAGEEKYDDVSNLR